MSCATTHPCPADPGKALRVAAIEQNGPRVLAILRAGFVPDALTLANYAFYLLRLGCLNALLDAGMSATAPLPIQHVWTNMAVLLKSPSDVEALMDAGFAIEHSAATDIRRAAVTNVAWRMLAQRLDSRMGAAIVGPPLAWF
jgi:hypothetical protein